MYNLSNHYENIYQYLTSIVTEPRLIYLHPFGSTKPENIEAIRNTIDPPDLRDPPDHWGPLYIFYDQEPLNFNYNEELFSYILENTQGPYVLVNTERVSDEKDRICDKYGFAHIDYFFHIFAAHDWYRGHEYVPGIKHPRTRNIEKTFISFNRLTSNERIYRSIFVSELYKNNLLTDGHVSFSKFCPDGGDYAENLRLGITNQKLNPNVVNETISNIARLPELRIDYDNQFIPNQSMLLTPLPQLMESFVFVVTETCYWQRKTHLTEKIFKPIVLRMPFLLLGCAYNLEYLRSYGFRTFGDYWDESYDTIEDPVQRLQAVTKVLSNINSLTKQQQKNMLIDMLPVLEHNYNLFTDPEFVRREWQCLLDQLQSVTETFYLPPPYYCNIKTQQRIAIES